MPRKTVQKALDRQVVRLVEHLLKLAFFPHPEPRRGWRNTIRNAREEIVTLEAREPSLKRYRAAAMPRLRERGTRNAVRELWEYGAEEGAVLVKLGSGDRWTDAEILGDWFPDEPDETGDGA